MCATPLPPPNGTTLFPGPLHAFCFFFSFFSGRHNFGMFSPWRRRDRPFRPFRGMSLIRDSHPFGKSASSLGMGLLFSLPGRCPAGPFAKNLVFFPRPSCVVVFFADPESRPSRTWCAGSQTRADFPPFPFFFNSLTDFSGPQPEVLFLNPSSLLAPVTCCPFETAWLGRSFRSSLRF